MGTFSGLFVSNYGGVGNGFSLKVLIDLCGCSGGVVFGSFTGALVSTPAAVFVYVPASATAAAAESPGLMDGCGRPTTGPPQWRWNTLAISQFKDRPCPYLHSSL